MITKSFNNFWLPLFVTTVLFVLFSPSSTEAATLRVTPDTGVYTVGNTFTVRVLVNTQGQPINAAEGTISFNPSQLQVVSASRGSSIFNLWTAEPSYSNTLGTITFGGGSPTGYTGAGGTVMSVTFRAVSAGSFAVRFSSGSILAADGLGTNVLSSMSGGTYTIASAVSEPPPEYVAPVNTPAAPVVKSNTHPNPSAWYTETTASLTWSVPNGVTSVRTLLDNSPSTVPTKVYENPISNIELADLPEGESYFHIQYRNADGWGRITHYRLAVDTTDPSKIDLKLADDQDPTNPNQVIEIDVSDATSPVNRFLISIDDGEVNEFLDEDGDNKIELPALEPGRHSLIVEAFDAAGNSIVGTLSFSVLAFDKPTFTEYPTEINDQVIPVIKGITKPNSKVNVSVASVSGDGSVPTQYETQSDAEGVFIFIPEGRFDQGVYEITAVAIDENGAQSNSSDPIRLAVQPPGYIKIGSWVVSLLSVMIPLIALVGLLALMVWYFIHRLKLIRRYVVKETEEALAVLEKEFSALESTLRDAAEDLRSGKKSGKLTKNETELVEKLESALERSEKRVKKEVSDVDDMVKK